MHEKIVRKRIIGINFSSEGKANVLLWAPESQLAEIHINERKILSLNARELGYWELQTSEIKPGDNYQISLDEQPSLPDPASLYQPHGVHGPSQAFDLNAFAWNDTDWKGVDPKELIIYELHTGTFTPMGTFEAIARRLDYLKELGITAVEIMPVAQFPGSHNWGYDGVFPFAVQNSYGGPAGLQKLVNACHKKKIAVILDVVYNHLGPEGNYLARFGPYFTDKYHTPWGNAVNFDDAWCDGVRRFYIENALMWLRDFHIDGLRLDAIHALRDFSAKHILEEIREHVNELIDHTHRNHFLIGESDLNDVRYINPTEKGGYGLDHQWCDEFHHALHALVTNEKRGYYSDFGSIYSLVKSFNDAFVFDGVYSPHRKKTFGNKTTGLPGFKFIVFTQNHDQVGNRIFGDRLSTLVDFEMLKLLGGALFVSPFIPMLFMGEEYGETAPFLYFTSHSDEELIRQVREGRKNEFRDFPEEGQFPDPQSPQSVQSSQLNWSYRSDKKQASLLSYYKELIRLKKNHPVLKNTPREGIVAEVINNQNAIFLTRIYEDNLLIAIMNFEPDEILVDLSAYGTAKLFPLLNSADEKWGGYLPDENSPENILELRNMPGFSGNISVGNRFGEDINVATQEGSRNLMPVKSPVCVSPESILILSDIRE